VCSVSGTLGEDHILPFLFLLIVFAELVDTHCSEVEMEMEMVGDAVRKRYVKMRDAGYLEQRVCDDCVCNVGND
jgi:hypothetical protein